MDQLFPLPANFLPWVTLVSLPWFAFQLRKAVESTNSGDFPKPQRERGIGGTFREKFLRSTVRRKVFLLAIFGVL